MRNFTALLAAEYRLHQAVRRLPASHQASVSFKSTEQVKQQLKRIGS
jgi:hypothetical protein